MIYVITYDVSDDKLRLRLSKFLEGFGHRVQESVFECRPAPGREGRLWRGLKRRLGDKPGSILVYQVCDGCYRRSFGFGTIPDTGHDQGWYMA